MSRIFEFEPSDPDALAARVFNRVNSAIDQKLPHASKDNEPTGFNLDEPTLTSEPIPKMSSSEQTYSKSDQLIKTQIVNPSEMGQTSPFQKILLLALILGALGILGWYLQLSSY